MNKLWTAMIACVMLLLSVSPVGAQDDWKNEPEAQFVERTYAALHGRMPNDDGWLYWVGKLENESPKRVVQQILALPEFQNNNPTFVEVYADLFGRDIDASGAAFWPTQDYLFAVTYIITSPEALRNWGHTAIPVKRSYRPVWDRVAECESGGDWSINTGNGYYGGLQFSLSSWRYVGGTGYPHNAFKAEQIKRAELLVDTPPYERHWPVCGPRAGLLS